MSDFNTFYFDGKVECLEHDGNRDCFPIGQLMFSIIDTDWEPIIKESKDIINTVISYLNKNTHFTIEERMQTHLKSPYYLAAQLNYLLSNALKSSPLLSHLFITQVILFIKKSFEDKVGLFLPRGDMNQISDSMTDPYNLTLIKKRLAMLKEDGGSSITANILEHLFHEYPNYSQSIAGFEDVADYKLVETAMIYMMKIKQSLYQLQIFKNDMESILACTLDADGKNSELKILKRLELVPLSLIQKYENTDSMVYVKSGITDGIMSIGYYSENVCSLAFLEFEYMCAHDISVRKCAHCGRYFLPFSTLSRYCDRISDTKKQKTCKDIAAMEKYSERINNDTAKKLYRQRANTYQMRCSRAPLCYSRDEYESWKKKAKAWLKKLEDGDITVEEFDTAIQIPDIK